MLYIDKNVLMMGEYGDDNKEERVPIVGNDVLSVLSRQVTLPKVFTLRDFFEFVIKNNALQLLDKWFIEYINAYNKCKEEVFVPTDSSVDIIMLQRVIELSESSIDADFGKDTIKDIMSNTRYNDEKSASTYINVNGRCSKETIEESLSYALDFTPLVQLLDCNIQVIPNVNVSSDDIKQSVYKNTDYEDYNGITLFELVTSIIDEISFHGDEGSKEDMFNDLKDMVEDIDSHIGL